MMASSEDSTIEASKREAPSASLRWVISLLRLSMEVVECFNPETNTCPLQGHCHLSRGIQRALRAFLSVLDDLTIADIIVNRGELMGLFEARSDVLAPAGLQISGEQ